jgi:hypothetical protein
MNIKDYRATVPATTNQILDLLIAGTLHRKKLSFPLNFVIKTNPNKLLTDGGGLTPSTEITNWLLGNCKKGCGPLISHTHIGFEDEEEAMLFKLTWG